ncbi:MAG: hypothetical protein GY930_03720 [bacterium]|nr:hypothetical protein [bacterium]
MDMPERGDPRAIDPGTLLTVLQAADWANVSVSTIRRRMDDGDLLFEVARERGRDVQRIRWVDLCDLFGHILEETACQDEARTSTPGQAIPGDQPNPKAGEDLKVDPLEVPYGGEPAREVVLERGLQLSIQTLTEQRDDLREQCYDLRVRLSTAEKERQVSVGALLQAQKHFLVSDHAPLVVDQGPFWKRPRTWTTLASAGVLLWIMSGMFDRLRSDIIEGQEQASRDLARETQERLQFQSQRIDGERRAMQGQLARLNEHNEQQRLAIHDKLEQDQGDRKLLWQQVAALGENHAQTQRIVQDSLDSGDQRRREWASEQQATFTQHFTQLNSDSMEALHSELALERDLQSKQQEAIAAAWQLREQRAMKESERLVRTVGDLVARVEIAENQEGALKSKLEESQATNSAFRKNLTTDLKRGIARWSVRVAVWICSKAPWVRR